MGTGGYGPVKLHLPAYSDDVRLLFHERFLACFFFFSLKTGTAVSTSGTAVSPPTIGLHPAARHKTAAASRGETLVPAAGSVSSALTLTAALRKLQRTVWKYVH